MSNTDVPSDPVAAVRAKIMEGLAEIPVFAAAIDKSPRTVQRMVARGEIPTVMIGRTPYVVVPRARDQVMGKPTGPAIPAVPKRRK